MDIQKLAAEMGLTCIKTYKLDALKAVCKRNESSDMASLCNNKDNTDLVIQTSESIPLENGGSSTSIVGSNADTTCKENGKEILLIVHKMFVLLRVCVCS